MSSYVVINLDTTAPVIDFQMPPYAAVGEVIDIVVEADEPLENWQNIQMINQQGEIVTLTFLYYNGKFYGNITVTEPITISYQFMDTVDNKTSIQSKVLTVYEGGELFIQTHEYSRRLLNLELIRDIECDNLVRDVVIKESTREINETDNDRDIKDSVSIRSIEVGVN